MAKRKRKSASRAKSGSAQPPYGRIGTVLKSVTKIGSPKAPQPR